jgi:hypothetical protein
LGRAAQVFACVPFVFWRCLTGGIPGTDTPGSVLHEKLIKIFTTVNL